MIYLLGANLVVLIHLAFVVFVVLGGVLVLRWRRVMWLHLPAAVWGALIEFMNWPCPLTPLENWLRHRAGVVGYQGGFIEHYLLPLLYPAGLTRGLQVGLGIGVLLLNLGVYLWVWRKMLRR